MSASTPAGECLRPLLALAGVLLALAARGQIESPTGQSLLAGTDWHVLAGGSAQVTYDSNPFIQPSGGQADDYFDLAPTIAVGLGDFRPEVLPFADIPHFLVRTDVDDVPDRDIVYLRYTPDFQWWDRYHQNNTVNEDIQAEARTVTDRIDVAAILRVQSVTSPDIDAGSRLRQNYATADVSAKYALTGRTDVGAEAYGNRSSYSGGITSTEAWGELYADYAVAPKTSVGLGIAGGGLEVDGGPRQSYWRPLLRWSYLPTSKLTFYGNAGVEFRSFDGARPTHRDGVVDLGGSYDASASTSFTVSAQRQTMASALYADEDLVESLVQASVSQRLFQELYGTLAAGYAHDGYYASALAPGFVPRADDYDFVRIGAAHDLTRHGTIQVSYEHRNNDSTVAAFGFVENLAVAEASFLF